MSGQLASIVYSPQPGSFNRHPLPEATLLAGYGIDGDRKGGHPSRNLNVMDQEMLNSLAAEGYPTGPGVLGENLIVAGVNLGAQPDGVRLRIGLEAVIEVVRLREPCYKLTALDPRMPDSVVDRVGVMARVVESGVIRVGDAVAVL
ncbi:MAG TPA: MOSC domain-containing protein [Anaerolineae bacterium]|nr:MOSC domain-containing protein [Anaerolineae bacterium]